MKYCLFAALCLISLVAGQVMAQETENDEQLKILSDSELKTEGAATRKPLDKGDDNKKGEVAIDEGGKNLDKQTEKKLTESPGVSYSKRNILSLGIGRLFGTLKHSTGAITNITGGGNVLFNPSVETELPLEAYVLSIKDTLKFTRKWEVSLCMKKSLGIESGTAKGHERGILYTQVSWWPDPDSLDIKWEADSELDLLMVGIDLKYRLYNTSGFTFSTGLGYIQKHLNFTVDEMYYYTPSIDDFLGTPSAATAIPMMLRQYSYIYDIPYAEIMAEYQLNSFIRFSANIGYSPYLTIENDASPMPIDDSFDGYFNNNGDADGNAIMLSVEGEYIFYKNWIMNFNAEYIKTDTSGTEDRYYSGLWVFDIEQEVESEEIYILVEVVYEF